MRTSGDDKMNERERKKENIESKEDQRKPIFLNKNHSSKKRTQIKQTNKKEGMDG